jgi:phage baseplate assembly protein W
MRASHGDLQSFQGPDLVFSDVGQILGTRKGTLPWRPEFGSDVDEMRHRPNTALNRERAGQLVQEALTTWEPRVRLTSLNVTRPATAQNEMQIRGKLAVIGASAVEPPLDFIFRGGSGRTGAAELKAWTSLNDRTRISRGVPVVREPQGLVTPTSSVPVRSGLLRPFYRGGTDLQSGTGHSAILSNVGQVLGTRRNTCPWRPELGSDLDDLRHKANTPLLQELAQMYVVDALAVWEPRAEVARVEIVDRQKSDDNYIVVRATCRVRFFSGAESMAFDVSVK